MFTDESAVFREIANGIMFVGAIMVIDTFVRYIWRHRVGWRGDAAVIAASVLTVLFLGHALRALSAWMQFLYASVDWNTDFWANSIALYLPATIFIIIGKMLTIYYFSPRRSRVRTTILKVGAMIVIPVLVAVLTLEFA